MYKEQIKLNVAIIILFAVISCEKDTEKVSSTGIELSKTSLLIEVETVDTLIANFEPTDATFESVIWSSSDNSIATVNSEGIVTAITPGKALITATTEESGLTDTCIVTSIKLTVYRPNIPNGNSIYSTVIDKKDNIWCGGQSLYKFNGASWTSYLHNQGIGYVSIDNSDNIWVGTYGYGVSKFDGSNWITYTKDNSKLNGDGVTAMAADNNGNIWIGTKSDGRGSGVSKFDGNNWTSFTTDDGLVYRTISSIAFDNNTNVWFTAREVSNAGVSKFDGSVWASYTAGNTNIDLLNSVYSVAVDLNDNKWFGNNLGDVLNYDGTNWTIIPNNITKMAAINTIVVDSGNSIWFGTTIGLVKYDGTNWTKYFNEDLYYYVNSISFDSNGDIWMGTYDGLYKLEN